MEAAEHRVRGRIYSPAPGLKEFYTGTPCYAFVVNSIGECAVAQNPAHRMKAFRYLALENAIFPGKRLIFLGRQFLRFWRQ